MSNNFPTVQVQVPVGIHWFIFKTPHLNLVLEAPYTYLNNKQYFLYRSC